MNTAGAPGEPAAGGRVREQEQAGAVQRAAIVYSRYSQLRQKRKITCAMPERAGAAGPLVWVIRVFLTVATASREGRCRPPRAAAPPPEEFSRRVSVEWQ